MFELIKQLWRKIKRKRQKQFILLFILMILNSFAEVVSVGSILPFLSVLISPETILERSWVNGNLTNLGLNDPSVFIILFTCVFCISVLIAGGLRSLLLWGTIRVSYAAGADISIDIFRKTLYQPYEIHCSRNSSEVINSMAIKTGAGISILLNCMAICSTSITIIAITTVLVVISPKIAILSLFIFGLLYVAIAWSAKARLELYGRVTARESTNLIKMIQESLGGIRDVLLDGSQEVYCYDYKNADRIYRINQGLIQLIGALPRYFLESLGLVFMAIVCYLLVQNGGDRGEAIPLMGAFALGAQRLLPNLQQAYSSWTGIVGQQASLQDILTLLNQAIIDRQDDELSIDIPFTSNIKLDNVAYKYNPENKFSIPCMSLLVEKGDIIGIVGKTGSGKSTLIDIFMGLLKPTEGFLLVDGKEILDGDRHAWRKKIAHVSQNIYLTDGSIAENIAFGLPCKKINFDLVKFAAEKAQLKGFVESLPDGINTVVGENGVRLSGGQRQRIGIARAVYKQADIIVLDESTSALDIETEEVVMNAIINLNKSQTVVIVAHRLTTLRYCGKIYELSDGVISWHGNYNEMISKS